MNNFLTALALLLPFALTGIVLSFVNPIFPLLAEPRQTPPLVQGLFFSICGIPQVFVFTCLPATERKCGVKNSFLLHILFCAFSVLALSALHYIHSTLLFSVWSIFFRVISGFGDAGIMYQYRTLIKRLLPQHFALINDISVASLYLSMGIGPFLSAPLFAKYGFHITCYTISAITLFGAVGVCCILSAKQCEPRYDTTANPTRYKKARLNRLSMVEFLTRPRVFTSFLLLFLSYFLKIYFVPFFSLELSH